VPSFSLGQHDDGGPCTQMPRDLVMKAAGEHAVCVIKFTSLGDSLPDTCGPSPLEKLLQ
jgi:hypothetical protein